MTNLSDPDLPLDRQQMLDTWRGTTRWLIDNSWELAIAAAIGVGIAFVLLALRSLISRMMGGENAAGWSGLLGRAAARTKLFFIVILSIRLVSGQVDLPGQLQGIINVLFVIASALQVAIWVRAIVIGFVEQRVGTGEEHRTLGTAVDLIRVLVTVAVFAIAIVLILDNLGVNVTGLIAGLGIGGIAIGLAAQGIFGDLFAALAIIFDKPFRRGDTINVGDLTGTVEHIGLKSTRLRAINGEQVAFGNAKLLENRLHNFATQHRRRVVMTFGIVYQTPPEVIATLPDELRAIVDGEEHATFDRGHAYQFGASSIDFEMVYYIETGDYAVFMQARHNIMIAIMRRFAALGVEFAYPTQTTFTAAPDGRLVMPWPPGLGGDATGQES